jgi:hypothetical protein
LTAVEPQEVLGVHRVEIGVVGRELGDAGIVEQRIDSSRRRRRPGRWLAVGVDGDVALGENRLGALGHDEAGGLLGFLGAAAKLTTTRPAPRRATSRAMARPRPVEAPVTTTVKPSKSRPLMPLLPRFFGQHVFGWL